MHKERKTKRSEKKRWWILREKVLVIGFAFQDHVLASDTSVASGTWHQFTSTGRAVNLRVMIIVSSKQLLVAFLPNYEYCIQIVTLIAVLRTVQVKCSW